MDLTSTMSAICDDCGKLFQGEQHLAEFRLFAECPNVSLEKPRNCRMCLLIWVRHNRITDTRTVQLLEITYGLFQDKAIEKQPNEHGLLPIVLILNLKSSDLTQAVVKLAMIAANGNKGPEVVKVLPPSTDSSESLEFLKSSLKTYLDKHQSCRQRANNDDDWQPTRLIEISPTGSEVYLRDGSSLGSQPYITLSHCWGSSKPPLLTADNAAALTAGIPTTHLPKTFRDAIMIARQLCVSYIWIGSMCILQDNLDDCHNEASSICEVYSHLLCKIAATGALDVSTGLFFERDPVAECSFQVLTCWSLHMDGRNFDYPAGLYQVFPIDHWSNDLEMGPMNRRAWVMQERFLSTRVLHFSKSQLFWECIEMSRSEIFPEVVHSQAKPIWFMDSQSELRKVSAQTQRDATWKRQMYLGWQKFAKAYTRAGLTKESEKLVAINSIQKMISKLTGEEFIAGLWRSRLIQELCWYRYPGQETPAKPFPEKWRAPSWSWASNNMEIHPGHIRHHLLCSGFNYRATVEDVDVDAKGSGQLNRASLTL
ncbi:HET-domain-containing protein [Paramyrothecium foliicola]|nr:HET-domain-containing protein [Paramyrothecium foliicola]